MESLVSVIIPTYKRASYICESIDSVLNQTYSNIEIIVVDDNGRDTTFQKDTERLLASYIGKNKIQYVAHDINKNGSAARNTGFSKSSGDFVIFLDDDDILLPDMVLKQVERLSNLTEDFGAVYCNSIIKYKVNYINVTRTVKTNSSLEGNICREYLLGNCRFNTSTIMFRRSAIDNLKGFDESFRRHQDYELMVRFFEKYKIGCTIQPLVKYDVAKDSTLRISCTSDYEIKEIFFSKRGDILKRLGIYDDIAHFFWNNCAINSYLSGDKELYKKCREKSLSYKKDSFKDFCRINILKLLYEIRHIFPI